MEANELRIGNFIKCGENILKVSYHEIRYATIEKENKYEPISINEDWLMKFGANSLFSSDPQDVDASKKYEFKNLTIHMLNENINEFSFFTYENDCLEIKSVHQLQNLYFALTGEELTPQD